MGMTEKSVVRPVFSYYGKLVFSDKVVFRAGPLCIDS